MNLNRVQLDGDRLPGGPWVFGRRVQALEQAPENGSLVEVVDASGRFIGHGFYNGESDVRVRLLTTGGKKSELSKPREFLQRKLASADRLRRKTLRLQEVTDAYRVVHAEGDDLSGLIIDRLNKTLVCEYHALGFWLWREDIEWALRELYPGSSVVHRVPRGAAMAEGFGHMAPGPDAALETITEHGLRFQVRPGHGHKTGWFCDQRDSRRRLGELAAGADVLDLCTNGGGFALAAARAGARRVRAVDLDEVVLELASLSAKANQLEIEFAHEDAFNCLRRIRGGRERPNLIVLDPPKFAAGRTRLEEGLKRYLDLNALAFECVAPGGLVLTFSCSGALDLPGFLGMLFQAGRRADRGLKLLETRGAGPDHPQRPQFQRSRYLKGALLAVD